jgi:hypothetical protein
MKPFVPADFQPPTELDLIAAARVGPEPRAESST